jgi:hypothetical protein
VLAGRWFVVLLALTLFVCSGAAWADMVQPPPENCPPGTYGASTHAGQYCVPRPCVGAGGCATGTACAIKRLCFSERPYTNMTGSGTVNAIEGSCDDGLCVRGDCRAMRVCLPPTDAATRPTPTPPVDAGTQATGGTYPASPLPEDTGNAEPSESRPEPPAGCSGGVVAGAVCAVLGLGLATVLGLWWRRRNRTGARH